MNFKLLSIFACAFAACAGALLPALGADNTDPPRTTFQMFAPWNPKVDLQSDAAIVYGADDTFAQRLNLLKAQGYQPEFMTGAAWGAYGDYLDGRFDGKKHMDDAQIRRDGSHVMHDPAGPYYVPSPSYREFLKTRIAKAIDAGATAIYLEEPEFWAFSGYEESFKQEYKKFYHEDWQPPHESVDARFRVDHLKYILYRDTLDQCFAFAKDYATSKHTSVRCYVATHSLISYAQIQMVSPMSSLMDLKDCDGYIAQVWTGTARHPNTYAGITKERTFETGYFEYAQMVSMVRPTGRVCYLLNDPVEDDPNYGWSDYEANYKRTLVASLMQSESNHFELAPWPNRVFEGQYYATDEEARAAKDTRLAPASTRGSSTAPSATPQRIPIPQTYATTLLTCFNALAEIPAIDPSQWSAPAPQVGILISDTLMFQRDLPTPSDPHLNNFFALAMPLLKEGIPAKIIQLETLRTPDALKHVDTLLLTYEGMKPLDPGYHTILANWIRAGGSLIIVDDQKDPYNAMRAWWNTTPNNFATPLAHLFQTCGLRLNASPGMYQVGNGHLLYANQSPSHLAQQTDGADTIRNLLVQSLAASNQPPLIPHSNLLLHRGDYLVAANMDESAASAPVTIEGSYIDLFDAALPVLNNPTLAPGEVKLYRKVNTANDAPPQVLASASRIRDVHAASTKISFDSRGPASTTCVTRIRLREKPAQVTLTDSGKPVPHEDQWDEPSKTLLMCYKNFARPLHVTIE